MSNSLFLGMDGDLEKGYRHFCDVTSRPGVDVDPVVIDVETKDLVKAAENLGVMQNWKPASTHWRVTYLNMKLVRGHLWATQIQCAPQLAPPPKL